MVKIKAVVFDYGNVISLPQQSSDIPAMGRVCNIDAGLMDTLYWQFRDQYDLQVLDGPAYWQRVADAAGITLTTDQVEQAIDLDNQSWARPCMRMLGWVRRLREHSVRTAVLSNMPMDLRLYLWNSCDWVPEFDHKTFSCEVGAAKPDAAIYLHCLENLNLPPDEVLFLDDRAPNVEAARKAGMHSEQYTTFEKAAATIPLSYALPPLN